MRWRLNNKLLREESKRLKKWLMLLKRVKQTYLRKSRINCTPELKTLILKIYYLLVRLKTHHSTLQDQAMTRKISPSIVKMPVTVQIYLRWWTYLLMWDSIVLVVIWWCKINWVIVKINLLLLKQGRTAISGVRVISNRLLLHSQLVLRGDLPLMEQETFSCLQPTK